MRVARRFLLIGAKATLPAALLGAGLQGCSHGSEPIFGLSMDCDASNVRVSPQTVQDVDGVRLFFYPRTASGFPGVSLNTETDAVFFSDCEATFASGDVDEILGRLGAAAGERDGRAVGLILCTHLDHVRPGGGVGGALLSSEATLDASYAEADDGTVLRLVLQGGPNPAFAADLGYSGCEFTGSMERRVAR